MGTTAKSLVSLFKDNAFFDYAVEYFSGDSQNFPFSAIFLCLWRWGGSKSVLNLIDIWEEVCYSESFVIVSVIIALQ